MFKVSKYVFFILIGLMFGIGMLQFSISTLSNRMSLDIRGVVVSRQVIQSTADLSRYSTKYQISQASGDVITYTAYQNDPSLSVDIPNGATLIKKKWELNYTVNDKEINDFPIIPYVVQIFIGFGLLCSGLFFGIRGLIRERKADRINH